MQLSGVPIVHIHCILLELCMMEKKKERKRERKKERKKSIIEIFTFNLLDCEVD